MDFKVPIDLEKYGWSESMINFLNDEEIRALVSIYPSALRVFNEAMKARDAYHDEQFEKVQESYAIKNLPNTYIQGGIGSSFPWIPVLSGLVGFGVGGALVWFLKR